MSKPTAVVRLDGRSVVQIEYVRSRRVLRVTANDGLLHAVGPVEFDFVELVRELQVDVSELVPAQPFMVFGGGQTLGGSKDCVGAFSTEAKAKECFVALRQNRSTAWAEVATVVKGRLRQLYWFGVPELASEGSRRKWFR